MLIKNINLLSNLLLLSVFSIISTNVAQANRLETKELQLQLSSEFPVEQEQYLISQSLGHNEYKGEPQMSWRDYQTGTVVGKNGSVISVVGDDGRLIHGGLVGEVGDTVLLVEENGKTVVLEAAHPAWVGKLQEDSGFSIENDQRSDPPLEARTAPLWQALGY